MIFDELNQSMESLDHFQQFVEAKKAANAGFLQLPFWETDGSQTTLLNYLIRMHNQDEKNLAIHISYLIAVGANIHTHKSIHAVFQHKKMDLLPLFIGPLNSTDLVDVGDPGKDEDEELSHEHSHSSVVAKKKWRQVDVDAYDGEGRTLISRAIEIGDDEALQALIDRAADISQPVKMVINQMTYNGLQALHQAVLSNNPKAVHILIKADAQVDNPYGIDKETPLLLAAREGQIDALDALLQHIEGDSNEGPQQLNIVNRNSHSAVDLLCQRLQDKQDSKKAIVGIAMLLCHGAAAPRLDFRDLLRDNRAALLEAVLDYTKNAPHLSVSFVRHCHDRNNALHDILYADKTWNKSIRHFFGKADDLAFKFETLVSRVNKPLITDNNVTVESKQGETETEQFDNREALFAEFVSRYDAAIKSRTFFNPWSDMRWKISRGEVTSWQDVYDYATARGNHDTRTARLVNEILHPKIQIHHNLNVDELPLADENPESAESLNSTL